LVFSVSPGGITTAGALTFVTLILIFDLPMPGRNGLGLEHTTSTITWAVLVAVTGWPKLKLHERAPAGAELSWVEPSASVAVPLMAM
jgi:hypothetical protein